MLNLWVFLCCIFCLRCAFGGYGEVVLRRNNFSLPFDDAKVHFVFSPLVESPVECGKLYIAEPPDACAPLTNEIVTGVNDTCKSPFVLIIRGSCSFKAKVKAAQNAGFKEAIIYDDKSGELVSKGGFAGGIRIHSVFVSKASGETLAKYAGDAATEVWINPSFSMRRININRGLIFAILVGSIAVWVCFVVLANWCGRRERSRAPLERPQAPSVREFPRMSSGLAKAIPMRNFKADLEENSTSSTCAICLEDYKRGEKLRVLPCRHKFHAICVDAWLTTKTAFCPVCKRDVRTCKGELVTY